MEAQAVQVKAGAGSHLLKANLGPRAKGFNKVWPTNPTESAALASVQTAPARAFSIVFIARVQMRRRIHRSSLSQ